MSNRDGSGCAFEQLAAELTPDLARYLERQVQDRGACEDLLQQTLLRIAQGLADFDGRSSVKTWAFTIAGRVAIDHFRRNAGLPPTADLGEAAQLPDGAYSAEEALALDRMNACVRRIVESLPETYREAVLLHDFGGLSARETAEACGCSEANAKVRIHRGRNHVKEELERQCVLYRDSDNVLRCTPKVEQKGNKSE